MFKLKTDCNTNHILISSIHLFSHTLSYLIIFLGFHVFFSCPFQSFHAITLSLHIHPFNVSFLTLIYFAFTHFFLLTLVKVFQWCLNDWVHLWHTLMHTHTCAWTLTSMVHITGWYCMYLLDFGYLENLEIWRCDNTKTRSWYYLMIGLEITLK